MGGSNSLRLTVLIILLWWWAHEGPAIRLLHVNSLHDCYDKLKHTVCCTTAISVVQLGRQGT